MRISQVIHSFPPYSRGGSENYVESLAAEQGHRHAVSVFHRIADPERPEYELTEGEVGGTQVVRINRTFRDFSGFADTYRSAEVGMAFGAYLDRFRPDVVHFHHLTCLSTTCVDEAFERHIPVVFTLHDFWLICPRGQFLRRDLTLCETHSTTDCVRCLAAQLPVRGGYERTRALWDRANRLRGWRLPGGLHRYWASRPFRHEVEALAAVEARTSHVLAMGDRVDRFISPSRFLRDVFVEFGVAPDKIVYSDNGFETTAWSGGPKRQLPPPGAPLRATYIGTWIPPKGVDLLIEAFRSVKPDAATLDVYGYSVPYDEDHSYEQRLRELVGEASHIRLHGSYSPADLPRMLSTADVVIVPSIWYENSPLTIHEAWLAGVPVIAAGHGGMKEYVHDGVNGLHFRPGSADDLRRAVRQLASDRDLLAQLSRGVPEVKTIEEDALWLEQLYLELGATRERLG